MKFEFDASFFKFEIWVNGYLQNLKMIILSNLIDFAVRFWYFVNHRELLPYRTLYVTKTTPFDGGNFFPRVLAFTYHIGCPKPYD